MSFVCPTVLARSAEDYREQMEAISPFASRVQIDVGDGDFTQATVPISDLWWPEHIVADIHLMYRDPSLALEQLVALQPNMVILHAEAEGDFTKSARYLHEHNVRVGVALLQGTSVEAAAEQIKLCDHVLIFSGSLGSFGGVVDLSLLQKVPDIRKIHPDIEIGWDGGVNQSNIVQLSEGGIDVLNVGGAIQRANHPENAYRDLLRLL